MPSPIPYLDTITDTLPFDAVRELDVDGTTYKTADLRVLEQQGLCDLDTLPVSIRILLDSVLRNADGERITASDVRNAAGWEPIVRVDDESHRGVRCSIHRVPRPVSRICHHIPL